MRCAYCERRATTGTTGDCVPACAAHEDDAWEALHASRRGAPFDAAWLRRVTAMADAARASAARPGHTRGWRMF